MIHDPAIWLALELRAQQINQLIQDLRDDAKEGGFAFIDNGGNDSIHLKVYGRGIRENYDRSQYHRTHNHDDLIPLDPTEVWQDSSGCSEQGTERLADGLYSPMKILTKPDNEEVDTTGWDESAAHWREN